MPIRRSSRVASSLLPAPTGIALTLLPVFYAHSDFGGAPPTKGQRRFVHTLDSYAELVATLARDAASATWNLGVAPHSLRAVTPEELSAIAALLPRSTPIHIHVAEQMREVAACVAWSGARPVEWLLDHASVDTRWCVVHATHMTGDEIRRLAASGAVAGLAPTTEADLGDGTFAARPYVDARWRVRRRQRLEHVHRPLRGAPAARVVAANCRGRRATCSRAADAPVGHALYAAAARGGAQAQGRRAGAIAPGCRADLVVLDPDDPALAAQPVRIRARCRGVRPVPRPGARRDGGRAMGRARRPSSR